MSRILTNEQFKEKYEPIFKELKLEGYTDRDADIIAEKLIFSNQTGHVMAEKHGMTIKEVENVYESYFSS